MRYLLLVLLTLNLFAVDATLTIEKDVEQRARIVLEEGSLVPHEKIFHLFVSDLKISGHFLVDPAYHQGKFNGAIIDPVLKRGEYVLKYSFTQSSGAKLTIRLIKTSEGKEIFQKSYAIASLRKMPFLVHKAVSDINDLLRFPSIGWINRYVVFARYTSPRRSEIVLADYSFTYQKTIIRGGLNLFPIWADTHQRAFYYTSYRGLVPTLYKLNIYTGARTKIIASEGMMVCSDVSKNGSKLLLTMAPFGQPDIYELNLATGVKRRVTTFNGIDVGGKYVDDESRIVFVSNRLGYANIFKKSILGSAVSQVVYHGRNNNAVDAYGKHIVYVSRESSSAFGNNTFNLYLTATDSTSTRPLTTTGSNLFPRFSSDGSVVQYIKHVGGGSSIGYINIDSKQSVLFPMDGKKIQSIDW
ncbi:tolB protein precursor, periplasmic protein involved in the tonb-independent uptake of group A colicins [hydrothermal vent metagenome]|uniref:TolB protein, periplasmic protein involved in the tonb-independent uptake of group A colicins n=1 Tax=hydrothermal vent metagenome TaxID=652676 RepID=A0A1W1E6Y0_9ZZZZ